MRITAIKKITLILYYKKLCSPVRGTQFRPLTKLKSAVKFLESCKIKWPKKDDSH